MILGIYPISELKTSKFRAYRRGIFQSEWSDMGERFLIAVASFKAMFQVF